MDWMEEHILEECCENYYEKLFKLERELLKGFKHPQNSLRKQK